MSIRVVSPADGSGSVTITWDNSQLTVPAGAVLDIAPGSALEAAYGTDNLADDQQVTAARRRTTHRGLAWRCPGSW